MSHINDGPVGSPENTNDEADILANQDETDIGAVNKDDLVMGAGPTNELVNNEPADFDRGEVDVVEQMKRAERDFEYPNRAAQVHSKTNA